jgi:transcription antitermination factor NusG
LYQGLVSAPTDSFQGSREPVISPKNLVPVGLCSSARNWFAVAVQPNHEKSVDEYLKMRGLEALCPRYATRRSWSDRVKVVELPLFSGYVFCRFSFEERLAVLSTPGVRSLVSFGSVPAPIPGEEIKALQSIGTSGLPARPWPYLRVGQTVRVTRGCLEGIQGIIVREKHLFRIVVSVDMLMRSVAVEVERDDIEPLK